MTTTPSHAAPWAVRRFLAQFIPAPRKPRVDVLTGREAVARALYGEHVNWSAAKMADYDNFPARRVYWITEADRRIASAPSIPDLLVLRWWGYTPEQWTKLPALVQVDKREGFNQARGL